jgi:acetyl esterase/lipase
VRARVSWPRPPGLDPGPGAALLVWLAGEGRGAGGAGLPAHRLFAEAGLTVLSVPWPARSEVPGEAAVQDAATALEWAADHAAELDADPARLLVAGEGLGAGLAAAVCLHARDQGWPIVGRQLLLFPVSPPVRPRRCWPRPWPGYRRPAWSRPRTIPRPSRAAASPAGCGTPASTSRR